MTTVTPLDRVMRTLKNALETGHPDAVRKIVAAIDSFMLTSAGVEAMAQPAFRKLNRVVHDVNEGNASRASIANTRPDKGAIRVIVTKGKGDEK